MEVIGRLIAKIKHPGKAEKESKPQGFTVLKENFRSYDETLDAESCPPGEYAFTVLPGVEFSEEVADIATRLASEMTRRKNLNDDLDSIGGLDPNTRIAHVYRLAHALEHLTVIDLIDRGVVRLPQAVETGARVMAYPRTDGKNVDGKGISFYLRKGLADDLQATDQPSKCNKSS